MRKLPFHELTCLLVHASPDERMFFSPFAVRAHGQRAMTKLEARDRAQLVVIAYRTGLARTAPDGRTDRLPQEDVGR